LIKRCYRSPLPDDEPPFDSADLENYDNDEEVSIAIMSKAEFAMLLKYNMQTMD
jgi:hypothetical protein